MELKRKDIKRVISGIMKRKQTKHMISLNLRKQTKYIISLNLPTIVSWDRASY